MAVTSPGDIFSSQSTASHAAHLYYVRVRVEKKNAKRNRSVRLMVHYIANRIAVPFLLVNTAASGTTYPLSFFPAIILI